MRKRQHSLRARIVLCILASVLLTSLTFGVFAFVIAYSLEDRVFRTALVDEIAHQKSSWVRTGALATPKNRDVQIYRSSEMLPPDIRKEYAENPRQTEFFGSEGRHYHVQVFELHDRSQVAAPESAIAMIEVSRELLVRPFRDTIVKLLVGVSLFVASLLAGIAWWFVNRAMKPLSDLARDVANSETAVPALQANRYPANEIGVLANALELAFARSRRFVEREQTFTRDASHELRTPLAVVRGAVEVIALNRDIPERLVEPLRRIETATTDMALALDQLLALARENKGVPKEVVALRPMVDKAVVWAQARYPDSKIDVSTNVDSSAAAFVHPTSLQLVLNNLIGNCFQHVKTGQLALAFESNCLSISDDGPGFKADGAPFELFAPFAKDASSMGSGLGLDICRRLCDAAGIGLGASGSSDGRGASFRLEFSSP